MEIKVFGTGCAKCQETENTVRGVVAAKGGDIRVHKVSDLKEMLAGTGTACATGGTAGGCCCGCK